MPIELPPRRTSTTEMPDDLRQMREALAAFPADLGVRDGAAVTEATVGGRDCFVCEPEAGGAVATLVWFHGGGYKIGSPAVGIPLARRLAADCGVRVVQASYALAPEEPFPAAVHDALAVVGALGGDRLLLGGDSAGGGLAVAATLAGAGAEGLLLLSPWLDLTNTAGSYQANAVTDELFSKEKADDSAAAYLQGHDAADPLASPLFGLGPSVPSTGIVVGTGEVLLDDALGLADRLGRAGVEVELAVVPGMPHIGPIVEPGSERGERVTAWLVSWLRRHLG